MRYRKKQVVIDALQWTGQNHRDMWEFLGGSPDKFIEPMQAFGVCCHI